LKNEIRPGIPRTLKTLLKKALPAGTVKGLRKLVDAGARPFKLRRAAAIGSRLERYVPGRKTALFFAPEGGVRLFLIVQAVIGKVLQEAGYNAVFLRCHLAFPRCPVKDGALLPFDASPERHAEICLQCHDQTLSVLDAYGLDYLDVRELLPPAAHERATRLMQTLPPDRLGFVHDGIAVGRLAFYDFSIAVKHTAGTALGASELARLDSYIETCLLTIEAVKAARQRIAIDTIACFDEYCMMSCARLAAQALGARVSRLMSVAYHFNGDPRRVVAIGRPTIIAEHAYRTALWRDWRDLPLPPAAVEQIASDLLFRLTGSGAHIYSPNKTADAQALLQRLGLSPERKLLAAFPSSRDELDALKFNLQGLGVSDTPAPGAFADQFEWLDALVAWVEASGEYQLVIRIHPRVGATLRDGVRSPDFERYHAKYGGPYRNCRIIWPEEKISSYDLAELADCALVSWSTMGLELARFGMPVLSGHTDIVTIAPPGEDFICLATAKDEYFAMLQRLCGGFDPASADALRLAYRWYNLFYLGNSIDMSDLAMSANQLPAYRTPANAALIKRVMIDGEEAATANLAQLRGVQDSTSAAQETAALDGQVARMVRYMATGRDAAAGAPLTVLVDPAEGVIRSLPDGTLAVRGKEIWYGHDGATIHRYSPLTARLGRIGAALAAPQ
jgi:hypothetical protein